MAESTWKDSFAEDGFVVIRGFLPAPDLQVLQSELDRYIRDVVPSLPASDAFYHDPARPETLKQLHRLEQDPFFAEYRNASRWREIAEALLGEPVHDPLGVEWFNKPPGTAHATPPHQDNYYFCLTPPQVLTIWLALDPVDEENGCLRYVRGSHRQGVRPHGRTQTLGFSQGITDFGPADLEREVAIPAQPGDALIHHGLTIHRAEANRSHARHRRSFGLVFKGISCQRDDTAFARYQETARMQHRDLGVSREPATAG